MTRNRWSRVFGNLLLMIGLILLATAAASYAWPAYEGERLRVRLRAAPALEVARGSEAAAISTNKSNGSTPAPERASRFDEDSATPITGLAPASVSPRLTRQARPEVKAITPTPSMSVSPTTKPISALVTPAAPTFTAVNAVTPTHTPTPAPSLPARLVIPDLGIDASVVEMGWRVVETASGPRSEWEVPAYAAGHHKNSAPLGAPGNVVISGHNNVYGRVFAPISLAWDTQTSERIDAFTDRSDVLNGRPIQLYSPDGRRFDYVVTDFIRVLDKGVSEAQRVANARFLEPTTDARLTLITCWPMISNTHRLILLARPLR